MAAKKKEDQTKAQSGEQNAAPPTASFASELRAPRWSVVSFEKREATGLTYTEAEQKLSALEAENVSGLCIVTDEVAARIAAEK